MNDVQNDLKQYEYSALIYVLFMSAHHEWERMRELAYDGANEQKIYEYFTKIFAQHYNEEIIPINSRFFRARQIKRDDTNYLGVNNIKIKELDLLQKECDKINKSNIGITISLTDFLYAKYILIDGKKDELNSIIISLTNKLKGSNFLGFDAKNSGLPPKDKRK